jgi:hypothetical protein
MIIKLLQERILWKEVRGTTYFTFFLILVLLPFSRFWATILIFALISLWSRIACLVTDYTKDFDLIDFFSVILAINVGAMFAGLFVIFIMVFSWFFGTHEDPIYTMTDTISMFFGAILSPIFFHISGNMLYSMYFFTFIRYTVYIIISINMFGLDRFIIADLPLGAIGLPIAYLTNTFMMKNLGVFFADVISSTGITFSFKLFLLTSIIVGLFYLINKKKHKITKFFN